MVDLDIVGEPKGWSRSIGSLNDCMQRGATSRTNFEKASSCDHRSGRPGGQEDEWVFASIKKTKPKNIPKNLKKKFKKIFGRGAGIIAQAAGHAGII